MTALEALATRIAGGEPATTADARLLLEERDLIAVGVIADDLRRQRRGAVTTFVRVFEVHVDAVPAALPPGAEAGEIRLVGEPVALDRVRAAVAAAAALSPGTAVTGFTVHGLAALASAAGASLGEVAAQLAEAGLQAVAQVVLDAAVDPAADIGVLRDAGLQVLRLTVETADAADPLALVARARALEADLGGFAALAPLPRTTPAAAPSTGYDDVKLVAAARLLAANLPSIQVDWVRYGPKLAQVALTTGADDLDGVAPGPGVLGARRSPLAEVLNNIRAAGLEPRERTGLFGPAATAAAKEGA